MNFYGLLHLAEHERSAMNVSVVNFNEQVEIYLKCAINLKNSLALQGFSFTLITNKKEILDNKLACLNQSLEIIEIDFDDRLPTNTRFYSAHFKVDVFRYFSTIKNDENKYFILCDLDMVCLKPMPLSLENVIKQSMPMVFDISDQVIPAYGCETIIADIGYVGNFINEGRWIGGEFIGGDKYFFEELYEVIQKLYPNYLMNLERMHHVGDEALVSAAIDILRAKGKYIVDAGSLGLVDRYWNTSTKHHQKPIDYYYTMMFLHLPSDKKIMANFQKRSGFSSEKFIKYHSSKLKSKVVNKYIKNIFSR